MLFLSGFLTPSCHLAPKDHEEKMTIPERSSQPRIQVWAYSEAPESIQARCTLPCEWVMVVSSDFAAGLMAYLSETGVEAQATNLEDGSTLCWGSQKAAAVFSSMQGALSFDQLPN